MLLPVRSILQVAQPERGVGGEAEVVNLRSTTQYVAYRHGLKVEIGWFIIKDAS